MEQQLYGSKGEARAFHPSIHPSMDGITTTHVILLYAWKQSHYTATIFSFGEISPTGDQKKPSATSRKEFKKRTSRTFAIFLRKKKEKKEEFTKYRQ